MPQINVEVNKKSYPLACGEGGEERLRKLATYVDTKAKDLSGKLGAVAENKLLLMAAILIADELHDALEGQGGAGIMGALSEEDMAAVLNEVSADVEAIAEKLANA
ncbi:MAG: cell division protein ZapA [Alphaproteobacteria bacterium]|nr:cell division protein ZapA [Alphaproteobacteria bacterium]